MDPGYIQIGRTVLGILIKHPGILLKDHIWISKLQHVTTSHHIYFNEFLEIFQCQDHVELPRGPCFLLIDIAATWRSGARGEARTTDLEFMACHGVSIFNPEPFLAHVYRILHVWNGTCISESLMIYNFQRVCGRHPFLLRSVV